MSKDEKKTIVAYRSPNSITWELRGTLTKRMYVKSRSWAAWM